MERGDSKNGRERLTRNKKVNPEQYAMVVSPICKGIGYVQNPKRRCCLKGGSFIKKEKRLVTMKVKETTGSKQMYFGYDA